MTKKTLGFFKYKLFNKNSIFFRKTKNILSNAFKILIINYKILEKGVIQRAASLLSYYSVLAISPIFIFLFRLSQSFFIGFEIKSWLLEKFPDYSETIENLSSLAINSYEKDHFLLLTGSFLVLSWSLIQILINIEFAINEIWEVETSKNFIKRIGIYIVMICISPVLFILSSGFLTYITKAISLFLPQVFYVQTSAITLVLFSYILPYILMSIILTSIYYFMPYGYVSFPASLGSGFFIGAIYYILQNLFFSIQFKIFKASFTYGALISLPLLLFWFFIGWSLCFLGSSLTLAIQNTSFYKKVPLTFHNSFYKKIVINVLILNLFIHRFLQNSSFLTKREIIKKLKLPIKDVSSNLKLLLSRGFISKIEKFHDSYQLAKNPESLTIMSLIESLSKDSNETPFPPSHYIKIVEKHLSSLYHEGQLSIHNYLIKNVLNL